MPAAVAADMLASVWDQNAGLYVGGPAAAVVEEVCRVWLAELLGLPPDVSVAYVTGCQMAHVTALAAARHHVLAQAGWDVEAARALQARRRSGSIVGARDATPPIRPCPAAARDRRGSRSSTSQPTTRAGCGSRRLRAALAAGSGPTIVCGQAGEVNTGAFDPLDEIADAAEEAGAPGSTSTARSASGRPLRPEHAAPPRRFGTRRLVGDRLPQVAERSLRLRASRSVRTRTRTARRCGVTAVVSRPRRGQARAGPGGLDAGVLATGARLRRLRGAPLAREARRCRSGRALLRTRAPFRRTDSKRPGADDPERGRPQPGARALRGRRADTRR